MLQTQRKFLEMRRILVSLQNQHMLLEPLALCKKILAERIDGSDVIGTGKDGRITKDDAIKAVPSMGKKVETKDRGVTRKKLSMLRRKVAERLVSAKNETTILTTFNEVDMSPIFELRKKYKESFKDKHGVSLGFIGFSPFCCPRCRLFLL